MKIALSLTVSLAMAFLALNSCSEADNSSIEAPNGQYRLVERLCFCSLPEEDFIEYWAFDLSSESMSVRVVDSTGQELSIQWLEYRTNGNSLIVGKGREFSYEMVSGLLELTYLDDPEIADDELLVRLASY